MMVSGTGVYTSQKGLYMHKNFPRRMLWLSAFFTEHYAVLHKTILCKVLTGMGKEGKEEICLGVC